MQISLFGYPLKRLRTDMVTTVEIPRDCKEPDRLETRSFKLFPNLWLDHMLFQLANRLDRHAVIGEHADLGRDRHRTASDLFGVLFVFDQGLGGRQRIVAA